MNHQPSLSHTPAPEAHQSPQSPIGTIRRRFLRPAQAALMVASLALGACNGDDHGPKIDAQAAQSALDQFRIASARPGMSAVISSSDQPLWSGASGDADVSSHRVPTATTPYYTGSVGKLITVTAAMQLVEAGKLSLDADVSQYLGYKLENPAYPGQIITMRQILSHVSSLQDEGFLALPKSLVEFPNRDPDLKLLDYCRAMLTPEGAFYIAASFAPAPPESVKIYSNVGYAVAGCVIESAAREDFAAFTQRTIFKPLGMTHTSWRLADFKLADFAVRYADDGQPLPTISFADYPNGGLFSTPSDIARFMRAMLKGGGGIVTQASVNEMLRTQYPALDDGSVDTGLGWESFTSPEGDLLYGHAGSDPGASNFAGMNLKTQTAAVVFSNRNFLTFQDQGDYLAMTVKLLQIGAKR